MQELRESQLRTVIGIKHSHPELHNVEMFGFSIYMDFIWGQVLELQMQDYNLVGLELHEREECEIVHGIPNQPYILLHIEETALLGESLLIT